MVPIYYCVVLPNFGLNSITVNLDDNNCAAAAATDDEDDDDDDDDNERE